MTSHRERSASDAQRNELSRQASTAREAVQALRSEIAVAEERHRNAMERRQRAEDERRERQRDGTPARQRTRRGRGRVRRTGTPAGRSARRTRRARTTAEAEAREAVRLAREGAEESERMSRQARDQMRTLVADREAAQRELDELETRTRALDAERGQLNEAAEVLAREIANARRRRRVAREEVERAQSALDEARLEALAAREEDAAARAELGRVEDLHTAVEGRVNGLEGLERERVGLAPAAARLLEERDRVRRRRGPRPACPTSSPPNANAAASIERFLGMTVHAVLVRDRERRRRGARMARRATGPGPLLLLPLDAVATTGRVSMPATWSSSSRWRPRPRVGRASCWSACARSTTVRSSTRAARCGSRVRRRARSAAPSRRAVEPARRAGSGRGTRAARLLRQPKSRAYEAAGRGSGCRRAADASHAAQNVERHAAEALAGAGTASCALPARAAGIAHASPHSSAGRIEALESDLRLIDDTAGARPAPKPRSHDARANEQRESLVSAEARMDAARERRTDGQVELAQAQARLQVAADRERGCATSAMRRRTASRRSPAS